MLTLDTLTLKEREFYERAKMKLASSLMFAAFGNQFNYDILYSFLTFIALIGMMLLGFCSQSGGLSAAAKYLLDSKFLERDDIESGYLNSLQDQVSGQGFASCAYIFGSLICFIVGLYISPLVSSLKEKYALREPRGLVDLYRERPSIAAAERPSNA